MKIEDIDANFCNKSTLPDEGIQWHYRFDGAFRVHGTCVPHAAAPFCRLPENCLPSMNEGVQYLAYNTAGVRLRFRTDSAFVAVKAGLSSRDDFSHMPRSGSSGFDLYAGRGNRQRFAKAFMPDGPCDAVVGEHTFPDRSSRDVTLNFPLYNGVQSLRIGLERGAALEGATPYAHARHIVFYGSSITQGGCASRPGNAYASILSRMLDADYINLGFSGSARGEREMADLVGSLDMGVFVMDYDHNAPTAQHLRETHHAFYSVVRGLRPRVPIVMVSKPDFDASVHEHRERRRVIFETYARALDAGDQNVHFIDGERLFGAALRDSCTVDGCHPNDLGFMRMAEAMLPTLEPLLCES